MIPNAERTTNDQARSAFAGIIAASLPPPLVARSDELTGWMLK